MRQNKTQDKALQLCGVLQISLFTGAFVIMGRVACRSRLPGKIYCWTITLGIFQASDCRALPKMLCTYQVQ